MSASSSSTRTAANHTVSQSTCNAVALLTLLIGKITVKGLYTNNVYVIEDLITQLNKMNEQFNAEGKVAAEVSIHRIDKIVGGIGKGFIGVSSYLRSHA